jgi:hypothetical protein
MTDLSILPVQLRDTLERELRRAQMIASTPDGVWPRSLVELSRQFLRQWAGWNVPSLPTTPTRPYRRAGGFSGMGLAVPLRVVFQRPCGAHECRDVRLNGGLYAHGPRTTEAVSDALWCQHRVRNVQIIRFYPIENPATQQEAVQ